MTEHEAEMVVETGRDLSFSAALKVIKGGHRVRRAGWNGKGMHVRLMEVDGVLPFIAMQTVQGELVPWLASQTDILAEDWQVIPDVPA